MTKTLSDELKMKVLTESPDQRQAIQLVTARTIMKCVCTFTPGKNDNSVLVVFLQKPSSTPLSNSTGDWKLWSDPGSTSHMFLNFIWPHHCCHLYGPGKPEDKSSSYRAIAGTSLLIRNPGEDSVGCVGWISSWRFPPVWIQTEDRTSCLYLDIYRNPEIFPPPR